MNGGTENQNWFALQVRSRWESSTAVLLGGKGYHTLNPTYTTKKRWSGRVKEVSAPLFPGYIFCQFDVQRRLPVLVTPGVIAVVSRGRIPVPVNDSEIAGIQKVVSSGLHAEPWPYLEVGQRVRIEKDALAGLEGILDSTQSESSYRCFGVVATALRFFRSRPLVRNIYWRFPSLAP